MPSSPTGVVALPIEPSISTVMLPRMAVA